MRRWLALAAIVVGAVAFYEPMLQAVGDFLVINDPLAPADAVATISGNGSDRLTTAVRLLHDGFGRVLIISGGPYRFGARSRNSAVVMRDQVLAAGVPGHLVLVDDRATSTQENALGIARLMDAHHLRTAVLVTSPYHARRAGLIFARVFRSRGLSVRVRSAEESFFNVHRWWTRGRDRHLVTREYLKLLAAIVGRYAPVRARGTEVP
jgi:uncharacterized SAM-binding protein YcdF (DUF218 family)